MQDLYNQLYQDEMRAAHGRVQTKLDNCRKAIKTAQQFGFSVDAQTREAEELLPLVHLPKHEFAMACDDARVQCDRS
jgi:hypothetical protein